MFDYRTLAEELAGGQVQILTGKILTPRMEVEVCDSNGEDLSEEDIDVLLAEMKEEERL